MLTPGSQNDSFLYGLDVVEMHRRVDFNTVSF